MIDLNKGINLQIEGELGRFKTIPIDALVKIAQNFQALVNKIAVQEVDKTETLDLNNFQLELSSFRGGSAIPEFKFSPRVQTIVNGDVEEQRKKISQKLDKIFKITSKGAFQELKQVYRQPAARNEIVNGLFDFLHSFRNAPVAVVDIRGDVVHKRLYPLKRFNQETKNKLLTTTKIKVDEKISTTSAVARIKITKKGKLERKNIEEVYEQADHTLSFAPETIVYNDVVYSLNFPLRCLFAKEEDYYIIKNELIDIIGTGKTEDEAEQNFAEEFHYIFSRYNQLKDEQLTTRLRDIKKIINLFVKSVES